jgi:hypothetical protein
MLNSLLRVALALWVLGYLVIACVPVLTGNIVVGGLGLLAGAVLLVPWLIGIVVLGTFVWLTNPSRR